MGTTRPFGAIRKLPSGRFQARYLHLGRRLSADTTFATKAEARNFLAGIETDLTRGSYVDPDAGRIKFGEYAGWWLEQRHLRPRTRESYDSQLKHILPTFEGATLNSITPIDVRSWHGRLANSGLHANTVSKVYRMLRTIMTTAVDDGLLPSNPVHIKGASKERAIERPLLSWDDVAALAVAIHPRFEALVWTAAASGLRFGELSGLTVRHVDIERSEIRVSQSLSYERGRGSTLGPPKTDSAHRTVAIPEAVTERIVAHMRNFDVGREPGSLVFTSLRGSPLVNGYFAPHWRTARAAVGLDAIRFHDLRHLAGTEAATAGASLREVMARMGHSSSAASLRYLKTAEGRDRAIADAIAARMTKPVAAPSSDVVRSA